VHIHFDRVGADFFVPLHRWSTSCALPTRPGRCSRSSSRLSSRADKSAARRRAATRYRSKHRARAGSA
jgi:hypothetical protein